MSVTKIAIIVGASIITAGSTAAVATRDKWWPKTSEEDNNSQDQPESVGADDSQQNCNSEDGQERAEGKTCVKKP